MMNIYHQNRITTMSARSSASSASPISQQSTIAAVDLPKSGADTVVSASVATSTELAKMKELSQIHSLGVLFDNSPHADISLTERTYSGVYRRPPYIGTSGIIASGKTTLVKAVAEAMGMNAEYEMIDKNPLLPKFCADQERYSFATQIWFLNARLRQHMRIVWRDGKGVIQDRTAHEDPIFALMLWKAKKMEDDLFETYIATYHNMSCLFTRPDMYIYLNVEPALALERVKLRMEEEAKLKGTTLRACECAYTVEYLTDLKTEYDDWIATIRKTTAIPILDLDWNHPISTPEVVEKIRALYLYRYGVHI